MGYKCKLSFRFLVFLKTTKTLLMHFCHWTDEMSERTIETRHRQTICMSPKSNKAKVYQLILILYQVGMYPSHSRLWRAAIFVKLG